MFFPQSKCRAHPRSACTRSATWLLLPHLDEPHNLGMCAASLAAHELQLRCRQPSTKPVAAFLGIGTAGCLRWPSSWPSHSSPHLSRDELWPERCRGGWLVKCSKFGGGVWQGDCPPFICLSHQPVIDAVVALSSLLTAQSVHETVPWDRAGVLVCSLSSCSAGDGRRLDGMESKQCYLSPIVWCCAEDISLKFRTKFWPGQGLRARFARYVWGLYQLLV